MPDLVFYGASDDLIEVEGVVNEEFNCEEADFDIVTPDGRQARVALGFGSEGCWWVAYVPLDEGTPAPEGRVFADRYTAKLVLDVPEGTTVTRTAE